MTTATITEPSISDWTPEELPDLAGKRYIVTGGNSGIGFEAAKILAAKNADVVIAVRDEEKGRRALAKIVNAGEGRAEMLSMDLADMASIRTAATSARERFDTITALINNAGVMQTPKRKTKDGFELQLGVNHLGHFLWNALMIDALDPSEGRIVTVASIVHKFGQIDFDNLMMERGYDATRSYSRSKLANLMYALELDRRLRLSGSAIRSVACHPGYSDTSLQSKGPGGVFKLIYKVSNALIAQSAEKGAYPTTLAAADPRAVSGGYYGPTGPFEARGPVGKAEIEKRASDQAKAKQLWEVSEKLVGESFELP